MIGVFTLGSGIMMSVITNNVSALAALANGLLPLRKVTRTGTARRSRAPQPAESVRRERTASRRMASPHASIRAFSPRFGDPVTLRIRPFTAAMPMPLAHSPFPIEDDRPGVSVLRIIRDTVAHVGPSAR
jgi:hypothetical protein